MTAAARPARPPPHKKEKKTAGQKELGRSERARERMRPTWRGIQGSAKCLGRWVALDQWMTDNQNEKTSLVQSLL